MWLYVIWLYRHYLVQNTRVQLWILNNVAGIVSHGQLGDSSTLSLGSPGKHLQIPDFKYPLIQITGLKPFPTTFGGSPAPPEQPESQRSGFLKLNQVSFLFWKSSRLPLNVDVEQNQKPSRYGKKVNRRLILAGCFKVQHSTTTTTICVEWLLYFALLKNHPKVPLVPDCIAQWMELLSWGFTSLFIPL